jgi:glycosyltransferase involved in cell wall biosynthesis
MAKPVVSTSLGCQGIAAEHGRHLLIADDPAVFADEVAGLMADPAHGRKLGAAGRALVERGYGWSAAAEILDRFHGALLMTDQKPVPGRTHPVQLPGA